MVCWQRLTGRNTFTRMNTQLLTAALAASLAFVPAARASMAASVPSPAALQAAELNPLRLESALADVKHNYASGLANHGEVLAAERDLLACRVQAAENPGAELETQVNELCRRAEEYYTRCMEGGLADIVSVNQERLRYLALRLELERRMGKPLEATRARMLALLKANVEALSRREAAAQGSHGEVLAAERDLLACRVQAAVQPDAALWAEVNELCRRAEEYHLRCLNGAVTDIMSLNRERLRYLALLLEVERRMGKPLEATRTRMLACHDAMVELCERRCRAGLANQNRGELEAARRARAAFLAEEK